MDKSVLDQKITTTIRLPIKLKMKVDEYIHYIKSPQELRPKSTQEWPTNMTTLIEAALYDWLARHPQTARSKTRQAKVVSKTVKKPRQAKPKKPKNKGE